MIVRVGLFIHQLIVHVAVMAACALASLKSRTERTRISDLQSLCALPAEVQPTAADSNRYSFGFGT